MNTQIRLGAATGAKDGRRPPPAQRRFDRLVREIEGARARLQAWEAAVAHHRQRHAEEIVPLLAREQALHRDWLFALDRAATRRAWSRADARTLDALIHGALLQHLAAAPGDAQLRALFERRTGKDYDAQRSRPDSAAHAGTRHAGTDEGDERATDARRARGGTTAAIDDDPDDGSAWEREQERHRADAARARAEAASARARADHARVTQSVRDVYRKLVSALHPDREPDETRRLEKTVMMQKVNEAYERNDLLTLLEAQLQLAQLDVAALGALDRSTLARYNTVLAEQLSELEEKIADAELAFMLEFDVDIGQRVDPARMGTLIERARRDVKASMQSLARQIEWMHEPAMMRAWLRSERAHGQVQARQAVNAIEALDTTFGDIFGGDARDDPADDAEDVDGIRF